jgi:hypothetical protein
VSNFIARNDRLRRIGDLLLKAVYVYTDIPQDAEKAENGSHERSPGVADRFEAGDGNLRNGQWPARARRLRQDAARGETPVRRHRKTG